MKLQSGGTLIDDALPSIPKPQLADGNLSAALDPSPLIKKSRGWTPWVAPLISMALLVAVIAQIDSLGFAQVANLLSTSPFFWLVFALYYFAGPVSEWIIYRKLWKIPASGIGALIRKLVSNEVLVGYIGEVYFYAWAREKTDMPNSPFGAIKDVTILSAIVGNGITLVLLAVLYPWFGELDLGAAAQTIYWSVGIVLLTTLLFMIFRRRLFTLPRTELWFISVVHFARIVVSTFTSALLWHLILPDIALVWWVLLASARLFISRLPLLPNKDILFAGLAVFFIGNDLRIGALMTLMATVILTFHIILGIGLSLPDLVHKWRKN